MCGRFTHLMSWADIYRTYMITADFDLPVIPLSYNVAPTQVAPVVVEEDEKRHGALMKWGLVPSWAEDEKIGSSLINARAETVASKPAFRTAFRRRRCIVPASGFYEWKSQAGGTKQPLYITHIGGELLSFAGLWERRKKADGEVLDTFTIITTEPNELMATIHNRMPVILPRDNFDLWLCAETPAEALTDLLKPYPSDKMQATPVTRRVGNPRFNSPECVQPDAT